MSKNKIISIFLSIVLITVCFAGCNKKQKKAEVKETQYYSFKDDKNRTVTLNKKPKNVIALIGSYGELWMLSGGELSGITNDAVTRRKMELPKSTEIIGTVKEPNIEKIISKNPDLVIMSTDIKQHLDLDKTLNKSKIPHAYFKVDTFDEYLNMLKICTDINKKPENYKKYGTDLKEEIDKDIKKASSQKKPKILLIRAMSTKAKALKEDHLVGKMLEDLNTDNIASRHESLLEDLSMETIISEDPDYIFVVTMGSREKAIKNFENTLMKNPAWNKLKAVKNGKFFVLPKDKFQYKPNSRWAESYDYLEKVLYENYQPQK